MATSSLPNVMGVIHLLPLPGSPGAASQDPAFALSKAGERAVKEAIALTRAGCGGLIIENFGDVPFVKDQVAPETVAAMAVIAAAVRSAVRPNIKIGINVLRNDARSALAIAATTGADFIRVNVLSGVAATDQGIIEGKARELLNERIRLGVTHIQILADVLVKHARTLSETDPELAIEEATLRAGAEGVIITGPTTGRSPDETLWAHANQICRRLKKPLFAGSGVTVEVLERWAQHPQLIPQGVIVGSTLRRGGKAGADLDPKRIQAFMKASRTLWKSGSSKSAKRSRRGLS